MPDPGLSVYHVLYANAYTALVGVILKKKKKM